jgi:hypothetical protein
VTVATLPVLAHPSAFISNVIVQPTSFFIAKLKKNNPSQVFKTRQFKQFTVSPKPIFRFDFEGCVVWLIDVIHQNENK